MLAQTELELQWDFNKRRIPMQTTGVWKSASGPRILMLPEHQVFHSCPFALLLRLFGNSVPHAGAARLCAADMVTHTEYTHVLHCHTHKPEPRAQPCPASLTAWTPPQAQNTGMEKAALTVGHRGKAAALTLQQVEHLTWLLWNDCGTSLAYITYWYQHLILSPSRSSV